MAALGRVAYRGEPEAAADVVDLVALAVRDQVLAQVAHAPGVAEAAAHHQHRHAEGVLERRAHAESFRAVL